MELEDEDLDAGAWGDPDLDLEPHADGEENGEADYDRADGDAEDGNDDEGGWEMEVPSGAPVVIVYLSAAYAVRLRVLYGSRKAGGCRRLGNPLNLLELQRMARIAAHVYHVDHCHSQYYGILLRLHSRHVKQELRYCVCVDGTGMMVFCVYRIWSCHPR